MKIWREETKGYLKKREKEEKVGARERFGSPWRKEEEEEEYEVNGVRNLKRERNCVDDDEGRELGREFS